MGRESFIRNYLKFITELVKTKFYVGYIHTPSNFDYYLKEVGDHFYVKPVLDYVSEYLDSVSPGKDSYKKSHYNHLLQHIIIELDSRGFSGKKLLAEVVTHTLIYNSIRYNKYSDIKDNYDQIEGKLYISDNCRSLKLFIKCVNIMGSDIDDGHSADESLRSFFLKLVHGLCERCILVKHSHTFYNEKLLKPQSSYTLEINIKLPLMKFVPELGMYLTPQIARSFRGDVLYLDKHFIHMESCIKRNKKSTVSPECSSPKIFNMLSSVKHYIDDSLLISNIDWLAKKHNLPLYHNDISGLLQDMGDCTLALKTGNSAETKRLASEQYSRLYESYMLYVVLENENFYRNGVHFRFYADFRGRVYANSVVGPTHNKIMRYSLRFDEYGSDRISAFPDDFELKHIFDKYGPQLGLFNKTSFQQYVTCRVLIEIGKIYKREAGNYATLDQLAEIGFNRFNKRPDYDDDEFLEWSYYRYVLAETFRTNDCPYSFFADATASGLQVLSRILKAKSKGIEKILNLYSQKVWCDTYGVIIDNFLAVTQIPDSIKHYFVRKHLKKTIMVKNFSGSLNTCFQYFKESTGAIMDRELSNDLYKYHKLFYDYIHGIFIDNTFFENKALSLWKTLGDDVISHLKVAGGIGNILGGRISKELENSTILKNKAKPAFARTNGVREGHCRTIERLSKILKKIPLSKPSTQFRLIEDAGFIRQYYTKEYNEYFRHKTPFGVRNFIIEDLAVHNERVTHVAELIAEKINHYKELDQNPLTPYKTNYSIIFPDGFKSTVIYMHEDVKRNDVKSSIRGLNSTKSFVQRHSAAYVKPPKDVNDFSQRLTEEVSVLTNSVNGDKLATSLCANIVHAVDAYIMREMVAVFYKNKEPVIAIHDCVGVRVLAKELQIKAAQDSYTNIRFRCGGGLFVAEGSVRGKFIFL